MKRIFYLIFLVLFISCSSSHSSNDSDILPDADADTQDSETIDDDFDSQDADIIDDKDQSDDSDSDSEKSDSAECKTPLSEAPFPYYDANGKITFCRPGCDTPTEKDPQCVRNLWDEQNEKLCHEYPEYACCGTPCVLENLKPWTKERLAEEYPTIAEVVPMHKCDLAINQVNWNNDGTNGFVKSWNMSDGKIGFYFAPNPTLSVKDWAVKTKYVTYDIATQKYSLVIPSRGQEQAYYKGKRLGLISDKRSLDLNNENIFLAYISDDGKVEIVYDKKVKNISYEPALNEKWAFVNIEETDNQKMMYAKVGEWEWASLGNGVANHTSLVDNYLGIYDENKNGYICDLSKNPKSFSDCMKINRENGRVSIIELNKENPLEFVFNLNGVGITKAKIKDGKIVDYQTIISDFTDETTQNAYTLSPYQFKGNLLLYVEITYKDGSGSGGRLCYYRIDKKKKYCMKKMEDDKTYSDGTTKFSYGFSEFEGKWLLYQKLNSDPFILRDMNCYCKEEGVCPFEE